MMGGFVVDASLEGLIEVELEGAEGLALDMRLRL